VALGNVMLGAGQYVAFLQATSDGYTSWGSVAADAYAGGAFVFQNNNGDESQFGQSAWTSNWQGAGSDLAFSMTFDENISTVRLPAGGLLLIGALGGLAALRRRKLAA
ncbi:MAG: VPLPA-CTERM sorting domain-containing protein, partial [Paracoccaceae bacterium]